MANYKYHLKYEIILWFILWHILTLWLLYEIFPLTLKKFDYLVRERKHSLWKNQRKKKFYLKTYTLGTFTKLKWWLKEKVGEHKLCEGRTIYLFI